MCGVDISIAGGGVHQIKRHCANKKHCTRVFETTSQRQPTISAICTTQSQLKLAEEVCRAELCFARFVVEHNLPFAVADHFNKLAASMFPDSKIAQEFACARTKTAALVTHALAPAANEPVVEALRRQCFTVLCDGGNDNFENKYFGIMIKYWDNNLDKVVTRFLDAPVCNIATGESLFNALAGALETRQIQWENLIGFASDSASVMVGKRNSVLSRVLLKQPRVFSMGCVCHLAALCAAAGLKKLPISIDDLLIDIYYHFKHSSKRCEEFSVIVEEFDGLGPVRILKHCSTRWLSLERALKRLLSLWPALYAYFDREICSADRARVKRLAKALSDVETKLHCHFVLFALKPLNSFNTAFQTSASRIGKLQQDVHDLFRSFLSNFIQPQLLARASNEEVYSFDYANQTIQLPNSELGIGTATRMCLIENSDELEGTSKEEKFFLSVRSFYIECVKMILAKFPFTDITFKDLSLLDPQYRFEASSASLDRLVKRFQPSADVDSLLMELRDYQSLPEAQLPPQPSRESLEIFWASMGALPKPGGGIGDIRFPTLTQLCKTLLVLPHSTADPERLFSIIRKIETSQRSSLLPSTVCDILSVKINHDQECFRTKELLTPDLIAQAKTATSRSLGLTAD